jgi:hypothetical protein
MKKMAPLFQSIEKFAFISEASLRSDMAKRIMFSILPSLTDETHVYQTGGVVDYKALAAAIEGRHDIIRYASRACVRELEYYHGSLRELLPKAREALQKKDYETCLDACIKGFLDNKGWDISFGGEPWKKIATTAKNLYILDEKLMELRTRPKPPEDFYEQEAKIMKDIVIQLNIFDGLAHNTASIMNNMAYEEAQETGDPNGSYKNLEDIKKLMDAKEIQDPTTVFKMIEKELINSGDIHRYKDWTDKLRTQKSYKEEDPNLSREQFLIRLRKELISTRVQVQSRMEKLEEIKNTIPSLTDLNAIRNEISTMLFYLEGSIDAIDYAIDRTINALRKHKINSGYQDLVDSVKNTVKKLKEKERHISSIPDKLPMLSWQLGHDQIKKHNLSVYCNSVINLYSVVFAYLESI